MHEMHFHESIHLVVNSSALAFSFPMTQSNPNDAAILKFIFKKKIEEIS